MNGCLERLTHGSALNATRLTSTARAARRNNLTAIYALMVNQTCVYVGSTQSPLDRIIAHGSKGGRLHGHAFDLVILRWCHNSTALRIESQVIRAFWRKDQARLNRSTPGPQFWLTHSGVRSVKSIFATPP